MEYGHLHARVWEGNVYVMRQRVYSRPRWQQGYPSDTKWLPPGPHKTRYQPEHLVIRDGRCVWLPHGEGLRMGVEIAPLVDLDARDARAFELGKPLETDEAAAREGWLKDAASL